MEGKTVFVPFTLPGETWQAVLIEQHKNFDRALPFHPQETPESTIHRTEPLCPYFGQCGGCRLQHIIYEDQLRLKQQWLVETFRRIGHLDVSVLPVVPSPPWEYRNKITVPLVEEDGQAVLAFHKIYHPSQFVPITDCRIAHPKIRAAIPPVLNALNAIQPRLQAPSPAQPRGSRLVFRIINNRLIVSFYDIQFPISAKILLTETLIRNHWVDEFKLKEEKSETVKPPPSPEAESWEWETHAESFLQVNDVVRDRLYDYVLGLPYSKTDRVLDGYCGVGLLTQRLAGRFQRVVGVEANSITANDAAVAVIHQGLQKRIHIFQQTLERYLRKNSSTFDLILLNPPRSGLSKEVRTRITALKPDELVIISCHPAALARDAAQFIANGYQIHSIQPFDMFPQTYHLETVLFLKKTATK